MMGEGNSPATGSADPIPHHHGRREKPIQVESSLMEESLLSWPFGPTRPEPGDHPLGFLPTYDIEGLTYAIV
jgi:hypothetical protein